MAHQSHIKSEKYRQWVKAGLGLGYLKEGLAPFCDDVATQQHKDILDNIKQTKHISSIKCGTCVLENLQPDHVKSGKKQCPLRHANCNCCYTSGKIPCPNNVCGAIYDSIITYHASQTPVPNWKNTQTQKWVVDPWSIAKCFINAPGYEKKSSAADTDCAGLLHVIVNNKYFHNHVSCNMTGPNIFLKVRQYRNEIFHSSTMELDSQKTNSYIDDMIAVLQDRKELTHRQDAKETVKKLQDLKHEDFVITTEDVEKVLGDIREEMGFIKITMEATKEDCEDLKLKVATLETIISELKEVIKNLKEDSSRKKTDFDTLKADLREKLIEEYRQNLLQVSAMPCQPEDLCDFRHVYVRPRITVKSKVKDRQEIKTKVKSMSDIFIKDNEPLKSIYILGEAGSGKSSFCKSLVHNWCIAHSTTQDLQGQSVKRQKVEGLNTEDHFDEIKEMKNFQFLFFISLRHCTDKLFIEDMLEEKYKHPILKKLLERESETCLIVLDGLDEWKHRTTCPPERPTFSKYTVLTTSRPWKIGSLEISDNEMRQSIYIEGFDETSKMNMITNTVEILHEKFPDNKRGKDKCDPLECKKVLAEKPYCSLTHTAMMLQQLICLWFDDRLHKTSKCNLYTCMLDMFFVWYKKKALDDSIMKGILKKSHGIYLPEYFNNTDECKSYSYIIQGISQLAYETLMKCAKETSLTFDVSMFYQLGIPNDIKDFCLKLGILTEEKGPSLSASRSRKSHLSYIHKSFQEYLAAVYIVSNINNKQEASLDTDTESADLSAYLSTMINVKNVDELLEQENILIMLCGLEPRLANYISKFIYDIVARDERVVKYRTTIDNKYRRTLLIQQIQNLILNCKEETKASNEFYQFSFDLGDLFIDKDQGFCRLFAGVDEQNLTLKSVVSFRVDRFIRHVEYDGRIIDCMTKCKNLETIHINFGFDEELYQRICDSIDANVSTLKCLSVKHNGFSGFTVPLRRPLFRCIANMTHIVAFKVGGLSVTREDFALLCTFLSGTGNLQQISIDIKCQCRCLNQRVIDLSKHKQLQYLEYYEHVVPATNVEFTNLEVIKCSLNQTNCIQVLDFLSHCLKLKEIAFFHDRTYEYPVTFSEREVYYASVTSKLANFLSKLQQLRNLTLHDFTLTDNIIKCPSNMRCIESIFLPGVAMNLTTWKKFFDSVVAIPKPVGVTARFMCIALDGEECYPEEVVRWKGGAEAAAFQYVREREALCDVYKLHERSIDFFTKK